MKFNREQDTSILPLYIKLLVICPFTPPPHLHYCSKDILRGILYVFDIGLLVTKGAITVLTALK